MCEAGAELQASVLSSADFKRFMMRSGAAGGVGVSSKYWEASTVVSVRQCEAAARQARLAVLLVLCVVACLIHFADDKIAD